MKKVFCFGELLMRMSPTVDDAWINNSAMPTYIGGAELNVAKALNLWDVPVMYCSALPDNFLSRQISGHLQQNGIDTSQMITSGSRIGIYYMKQGADLKHASVIYDRAHSSFSCLKKGKIDWQQVLENVDWFHFSAITPALSNNVTEVCEEALRVASSMNIPISLDLNYRTRLWQYGKAPEEIMPGLAQYCDVIMGNIWAANTMLDIPLQQDLIEKNDRESYLLHAQKTSEAIQKKYPKCRYVANTYRFSNDDNEAIDYYATLFHEGKLYYPKTYHSEQVVDKSGSGDCFMAGLIYNIQKGQDAQPTIDFATAAAFSKLFVQGDATNVSVNEIIKMISHE